MINQDDPRGSDKKDTVSLLSEYEELKCAPMSIGNRKAFSNAAAEGLGVVEFKPQDKLAINEMIELYNHIYGINAEHKQVAHGN